MQNNTSFQIQNIKFQIKNIDTQLDNLLLQNGNLVFPNFGIQINNIGIQLLNMGIQMFNVRISMADYNTLEIQNLNNNIQNIIMELKKFLIPQNPNEMMQMQQNPNEMMQMNAFGMGMGMGIGGMPMLFSNEDDEEWLNGFQLGVEEVYKPIKKNYSIVFRTSKGARINISLNEDTTIDEMLRLFFKRIDKLFLLDNIKNVNKKFYFLFNGERLKFGDYRKIGSLFKCFSSPPIIVNELGH